METPKVLVLRYRWVTELFLVGYTTFVCVAVTHGCHLAYSKSHLQLKPLGYYGYPLSNTWQRVVWFIRKHGAVGDEYSLLTELTERALLLWTVAIFSGWQDVQEIFTFGNFFFYSLFTDCMLMYIISNGLRIKKDLSYRLTDKLYAFCSVILEGVNSFQHTQLPFADYPPPIPHGECSDHRGPIKRTCFSAPLSVDSLHS